MITVTSSLEADWRGKVRRFRVNEPNVVFEAFDEEIVAVNLETGNYYSLSKTGPRIWMDVANGLSIDEIVERLRDRHDGEREVISAAITTFIDRLLGEALIIDGPALAARHQVPAEPAGEKSPFEAPVLDHYSDMQDLLLLDPIHEVDTAGWPVAKTN